MWPPDQLTPGPPPLPAERPAPSGSRRDRLALMAALATLIGLVSAFIFSSGTQFLMPGPLTSAHGAVENCGACHTKSGSGKFDWVHGLVAGDPLADSKACLACHSMADTAFNPHGASAEALEQSTERMTKIAAEVPQPESARVQSNAFPTHDMIARGLYCATCHQEHKGAGFDLGKISNEQCRSCHVVKFDSFSGDHPKLDSYPFKRRTRIIYDHAGHFGKHYPEVAKKDPAKRVPATCSTCHDSRDDKRVMSVAPFEKTCGSCHLDQIIGKERVSGPKGIAFLTLPGLDLQTLKQKNAAIGEWPEASEAALSPFMKVMIGRDERGRSLIKAVEGVNLQDLATASEEQIKAVTDLAWEIKRLLHALIAGKASDVLADLNIASGAKLSAGLVADLTASIPRDVLLSAQQQWLPNLGREIASGPIASDHQPSIGDEKPSASGAATTEARGEDAAPSAQRSGSDESDPSAAPGTETSDREAVKEVRRDPPPCLVRVLGQCLVSSEQESPSASALPAPSRAGLKDVRPGDEKPAAEAGRQSDDLLFPTEEELRQMKSGNKGAAKAEPDTAPPAAASSNAAERSAAPPAPVIAIDSGVDPETWADYGGWYRQDYAIFYRPVGHKDKFIYSWLFLTGPHAPRGGTGPAAAVFDVLTGKDAQGGCTKCHSVDDLPGKGRVVNFSPPRAEDKKGHFTSFVHEPHFGIMEGRGCLTCHSLLNDRPYLKSYEQGNSQTFASNFGAVKKDLCQSCHNGTMARQDCLLCHKYHVNGATTPIMSTRLPIQ